MDLDIQEVLCKCFNGFGYKNKSLAIYMRVYSLDSQLNIDTRPSKVMA